MSLSAAAGVLGSSGRLGEGRHRLFGRNRCRHPGEDVDAARATIFQGSRSSASALRAAGRRYRHRAAPPVPRPPPELGRQAFGGHDPQKLSVAPR